MKQIKKAFLFLLMFICVSYSQTVCAIESQVDSESKVEFSPNDEQVPPLDPEEPNLEKPVDPVDPTTPDGRPEPGTGGPLAIDFASSFDFGTNEISNEDAIYYAKAQEYRSHEVTPNYVQVSDNRGTGNGWKLLLRQNGQFKTTDSKAKNKILVGAQITMNDSFIKTVAPDNKMIPRPNRLIELNPEGVSSLVINAKQDTGLGTWSMFWGKVEKEADHQDKEKVQYITKAVSLTVPGETVKYPVRYKTTLAWILSDVPEN